MGVRTRRARVGRRRRETVARRGLKESRRGRRQNESRCKRCKIRCASSRRRRADLQPGPLLPSRCSRAFDARLLSLLRGQRGLGSVIGSFCACSTWKSVSFGSDQIESALKILGAIFFPRGSVQAPKASKAETRERNLGRLPPRLKDPFTSIWTASSQQQSQ